ncbi:MAG: DUF3737 family protein [Lachnospiraceae bacterium]|jgi:hypothetical protein|nr:DUF3737 family protein [Lachnospiraceae bacterium]MEE3460509.1 DUF3737 family protein [Lachnospiraceae bacterium]
MKDNNCDYIESMELDGERALFHSKDLRIKNCVFKNGESPLKESTDIALDSCFFEWKYPLWYCNNVDVKNTTWFEMGRSGVWYTNNIRVSDSTIEAPKNFRRCRNVSLSNVHMTNALETFWMCDGVKLDHVQAKGDYFGMNSNNIEIDGLSLDGNYCFDGSENVVVRNSRLISKDAFWNTKNVTVYDSEIYGEYLAWNAENITFVNCTIKSLQGLCYIKNLKMINCRLIDSALVFEYSSVDADIRSSILSVLNPQSGIIRAESIDQLIMEEDKVDVNAVKFITKNGIGQRKHKYLEEDFERAVRESA